MDYLQIKQAKAQLLKGSRLQEEGIALQNDAMRRLAKEIERKINARNGTEKQYRFGDDTYRVLDISCEADNYFSSSACDHIRVRATFILSDLETRAFKGATDRERQLISEIKEVVKRFRSTYSKEGKKYLAIYLDETLQSTWVGLSSLKHKYKVVHTLYWDLTFTDVFEKVVDMNLSTGEERLGNTITI